MQIELKYIECPFCKKWYSHQEIISHSHFGGAKIWSDGKFSSYAIPADLLLPYARCEKCNKLFWFDDCRQIEDYNVHSYLKSKKIVGGKLDGSDENNKTQLIAEFLNNNLKDYKNEKLALNYPPVNWHKKYITNYHIGDYVELLEDSEGLNIDKEIYLRTTLNQYINDLVRNLTKGFLLYFKKNRKEIIQNKKLYKTYTKIKLENLHKLSELLQKPIYDEYDDAKINLIEIERELGDFDKAKSLIDNLDIIDKHNNKTFVRKSLELIKKKSSKVFIIK